MPAIPLYMNAGDKVTVKFKTATGSAIQSGTVVRVFPDGRFEWNNGCNYVRTARPEHVTTEPERAIKLDPYVAEWVAEDEG